MDQFTAELQRSISLFMPETALAITFILAILFDLIVKKSRYISGYVTLAGFAVTLLLLINQSVQGYGAFAKALAIDPFGQFFKYVILISSIIVIVFSFFSEELKRSHERFGEYYSLIAGLAFGMLLLVGSVNLIMIYVAIETMSISSYILAGYTREVKRSSEASLKYVIYGAVSSGIMIYGISILFGLTGSLNLYDINHYLATVGVSNFALLISGIMIISGIGYKISAVPFHFWTPDVYEGAPVTITAYLSVASKAAGFAVLIRFLKSGFEMGAFNPSGMWEMIPGVDWKMLVAVLAVLTMTLGNLTALGQKNVKRLLAYSSIAHAGYLLTGVVVMNDSGVAAVLVYFVFYMIMNLGAFFVVMLIADKIGSEDVNDYAGLGYRAPVLGVCMTVFLVSLTGLPPTAGFIGKMWLFGALVHSNYLWLAVIGVLNSVVSLFYYVKVFKTMYLKDVDSQKEKVNVGSAAIVVTLALAIPTLLFGLFNSPILNWAKSSIEIFVSK